MNKPIVLVVHGMGTHEPGHFKQEVAAGLNEAASNFGLPDFDFSDEVEFFQFNYSTFLDEIRQRDAAQAASMAEHLALLQGHGLGENMVARLSEFFAGFDQDDMLYTHWMDVLYYGLTFWGEKIRVDCARKINDLMIEANRGARDVHIIAHSLGNAVLHDTLAKLFRKDVDLTSQVPGLDIAKFRIKSLWTVANVSRSLNVLNDIADPNSSIVNATDHGCCDYLVNIRNRFDPFTWVKPYNRDEGNYRLLEVDTVRHWNTHDAREYLAAPPIAAYVLNFILGVELTQEQWDTGVAKHAETALNTPVAELLESVRDLQNLPDSANKMAVIQQTFTAAKKCKDRLQAILEEAGDE